jgi:hypothetical protein
MMARRWSPGLKLMLATPSRPRSLSSATFIGPGEGAVPGAGCGNAVERAVWKVDLLHHLVDMAVEHRHRAERLEVIQRAGAVLGAPAPGRIDRP